MRDTSWLRIGTLGLGLAIAGELSPSPAQGQANPWTSDRTPAVVRIEVPQGKVPSVGTGFLVKGLGGRYFVLTSTHVVFPEYDPAKPLPSDCGSLLSGTKLLQGNTGGPELPAKCVSHLGSDASLIELAPRDTPPYPALQLFPRDLALGDLVFLAGFALGGDRDTGRSGKVTNLSGPYDTIVTDTLTAEGMSGGPYLATDGVVVGLHRGGGRYTAGFPDMTPIWRIRVALEPKLGRIADPPPPPPIEVAAANKRQCIKDKLDELRSQRRPFTYSGGVACGPDRKRQDGFVTYKVQPGSALAGFVSHQDDVKNGWIGMLRYNNFESMPRNGGFDDLNVLAVEIPVSCDVSDLGDGAQGWARTELSGYLRKIDDKAARRTIEQACGNQ
jgi:hypothetical protein